jgi:pimeloyl-ACP methyl ester carboxylesterase
MAEPIMQRIIGDGVQINLAVWEGTGTPILCVHGITANCRCWDVLAAALAPEYRLMAMDLRGRGRSDKPSKGYSLDHHLRDIGSVLDDLGMDRSAIMGHSLGAFIALAFGAEHPDRVDNLILVDGGGDLSQQQFLNVFEAIKPSLDRLGRVFPSAEDYLNKMKAAPYIHPWSKAIETYYRYELEAVESGVRTNIDPAHIQEEATNIREVRCAAFYPRIRSRVLILRAPNGLFSQEDLLLPEDIVEKMIRSIPDANRFDVTGVNHYGIVFQPHAGRDRAIREFLNTSKIR